MTEGNWYHTNCFMGHQGSGKFLDIEIYLYVDTALEGYRIIKRLPGVKRTAGVSIRPLSHEESIDLERRISESGLDIRIVKEKRIFSPGVYKV